MKRVHEAAAPEPSASGAPRALPDPPPDSDPRSEDDPRTPAGPRTPSPSSSAPPCLAAAIERSRRVIARAVDGWTARGLTEGLAHQLEGGKGLRPALSLWFGTRLGVDVEAAERWGLAVELLHNAFLIHDDIEDGDRYRRGRPTLWVEVGIPVALNVADHLLAEAYRHVAEIPAAPEVVVALVGDFARTHRTTVEGQALDLDHRADPEFTLEDYERIIRHKTGRYLALAWVGPARVAGWSDEEIESLWRVGDELGPAFQIRDDVLDLTAGKGRGGEIGCDIREGKPSILVAHALANPALSPTDRDDLLAILRKPREETREEEVARTISRFEELGSIAFADAEARRRSRGGRALFAALPAATPKLIEEFESIAAFLVDRKV